MFSVLILSRSIWGDTILMAEMKVVPWQEGVGVFPPGLCLD